MSEIKNFFLPAVAIVSSSFFSIMLAVGIIIGYLFANYCLRKLVDRGKLKIIIFSFGRWKIHLHHWIVGGIVLIVASTLNIFSSLPIFFFGTMAGIILEDLHLDKDWYRVIYKE